MEGQRLRLAALFAVATLFGAVFTGCSDDGDDSSVIEFGGDAELRGVRQVPPLELPGVTLTAMDGSDVRLRVVAAGNLRLVYLGYTNCPDACPMEMARIAKALEMVPSDVRRRVAVQFVTTDPERDTPDVLREWLAGFGPEFSGFTGEQEALNALQRGFGLNPASHADHGAGSYIVQHSTFVMLFAPGERLSRLVYPENTKSEDYAADILKIIAEGVVP